MNHSEPTLETFVQDAVGGDEAALEEIVSRIQKRIYNLALRMLWHPADAEDATQEILVRIITNLSSYRGESAFTTWAYRVASNYLLTTRKRRAERDEITFEQFGEQLDEGLSNEAPQVADEVEHRLLIDEVRIGCTHGMLLCLDRDHRLAYILGEILEINGEEGGQILGITAAAFRKRLSRARTRILDFMQKKCSIFQPSNPCKCSRRVDSAIEIGRVDPDNLLFAESASNPQVIDQMHTIEELRRAAAIYRSAPAFSPKDDFTERIKELVSAREL